MDYSKFCKVVKALHAAELERRAFKNTLAAMSRDDAAYACENKYVVSLEKSEHVLLRAIFKDLYQSVNWILWEWRPGFSLTVNGRAYVINTLDDYLDYAKAELFDSNGYAY